MFMRYLGGGIGHLEQFPPANNDAGVTYEYEEDDEDNDTRARNVDNNGGDEVNGDEDGDDTEDEDSEGSEDSDPGESSDEDMGNVY